MTEPKAAPQSKCGKPAAPFIARYGMSWACVLPAGHDGECKRGGACFKHGEYVGDQCPQFPNCLLNDQPKAAPQAPCNTLKPEVCSPVTTGDATPAGNKRTGEDRTDGEYRVPAQPACAAPMPGEGHGHITGTADVDAMNVAASAAPVHTDHPLRHWDRTCPACAEESKRDISGLWPSAAPMPNEKKAEHVLSAKGVFLGQEGLRGLAECDEFWGKHAYGTRLYYADGNFSYLHRDVLRAAISALDEHGSLLTRCEELQKRANNAERYWQEQRERAEQAERDRATLAAERDAAMDAVMDVAPFLSAELYSRWNEKHAAIIEKARRT